jgi:ankyrin repeat protein
MVEILIDNGADPSVRELQFRTPLHYAAIGNRREVADLLWSRGANLNAVDLFNCTPEDLAPPALAPHLKKLARRPSPKPSNPDPGTDQ